MVKTKDIVILGRPLQLQERSKAQMKGVTIGDFQKYKLLRWRVPWNVPAFRRTQRQDCFTTQFVCHSQQSYFAVTTSRLVFLLVGYVQSKNGKGSSIRMFISSHPTNMFICRCFGYLSVFSKTKQAKALTPVAQYLLLYHLQIESIEGLCSTRHRRQDVSIHIKYYAWHYLP